MDVDFKIVSTFPGFGKFVSTTRIEVLEPASCLVELESVEIIRIGAYGSDQVYLFSIEFIDRTMSKMSTKIFFCLISLLKLDTLSKKRYLSVKEFSLK